MSAEPVPQMALTMSDIAQYNDTLGSVDLEERLRLIFEWWGERVGMTSAFGYSGVVLMHFMQRVNPQVPIYFIDTRFHFPQTMAFVEQIRDQWKLDIRTISTDKSEAELTEELGEQAYATTPDACCYARKVLPLQNILSERAVWLHALRRDQAVSRKDVQFLEKDSRGVLKCHPLADWTRDRCWEYLRANNVPYHPMHDEGYPSIGCTHCTRPVAPGMNEREGRWVSFGKIECGLHDRTKRS